MNVLHAIYTRRSVRAFTREAVDDSDIVDLIDAAIQAPNALNAQSWGFTVVTAPTLLRRIAAETKASALTRLQGAPEQAVMLQHLAQPDFDVLYGAPALVVIWTTGADDLSTHDCCLAAENLMLAAHAKGLGTCWIGFVESWLQGPDADAVLDLPSGARPVAPIILGYPMAEPAPPGRRPAQVRWLRGA
jgi:nitroreductase